MITMSYILILLISFFTLGCYERSDEQSKGSLQQEIKSHQPQIKKIPVENKAQADSLIKLGLDVLVVEETYVAVRIKPEDFIKIQTANFKMEPIKEEELIQRLVKIPVKEKSMVSELANLGMDIWEVKKDTVIAQVFDKQIREAEAKGFMVEIVARNVLDIVKKLKIIPN